ncbi:MAG: YegS/Rv2252/BmrU family lipid kinase [Clostridiales bacterium]|nr:YegS/Rv2252/BmrU family lipid kinase [Clostridiales bacterium]
MLYFIINERSGSSRTESTWKEVRQILEERQISYRAYVTEYEGHAALLAAEICEQPDENIGLVVVGGDGTINEVINGMTNFEKVRLGVIPGGSGNDFIRGIGASKNVAENLENILSAMEKPKEEIKRIDLGQVRRNGGEKPRLFAISAGVGLDAIVCKKALKSHLKNVLNRLHMGKLTYLALTVESLFSMKTVAASIRFDKSRTEHREKMIFAAAMNLRAEGGGVPMAPGADFCDGKLSVCQAFGIPKWRTFFCLPLLAMAKHESLKGFHLTDAADCEVKLKEPMVLHADGEYCGDVTEIHFSCLPGKLMVLNKTEK